MTIVDILSQNKRPIRFLQLRRWYHLTAWKHIYRQTNENGWYGGRLKDLPRQIAYKRYTSALRSRVIGSVVFYADHIPPTADHIQQQVTNAALRLDHLRKNKNIHAVSMDIFEK